VRIARRIEADVPDPKLSKLTTLFVVSRRILCPEIQADLP
jgi:hypothetical protein